MPIQSDESPKIEFTKSSDTKPAEQNDFFRGVEAAGRGLRVAEVLKGDESDYQKRELTEKERETVKGYIDRSRAAFESIGLQDTGSLCPTVDEITIISSKSAEYAGGDVQYPLHELRLIIPEGKEIDSKEVEEAFYHEVSHFCTRSLVSLKIDDDEQRRRIRKLVLGHETTDTTLAMGFMRINEEQHKQYGVIEEGSAELFTLYCMELSHPNEDLVLEGGYQIQTPLVAHFLNRYSQLRGDISPTDAFRELFRAKATRDYGYFSNVVDTFANLPSVARENGEYTGRQRALDVAWYLNNIPIVNHSIEVDGLDMVRVFAFYGDFYDPLIKDLEDLDNGKEVLFPGFRIKYKKRNQSNW